MIPPQILLIKAYQFEEGLSNDAFAAIEWKRVCRDLPRANVLGN